MHRIKKTFLFLLNIVLLLSFMGQAYVSANEENYSISSPEAFSYVTDLSGTERRQLFNDNWKFIYGEQSNGHLNTYDDSHWESIQLPHDYSLTLPYTRAGEAESGYKLGGIGWYRNSFTLSEDMKDKRIMVDFGGVYMNATVYINGHKLGEHPYGYTPFAYDLTEYIDYEGENVLAVRVNHKFPSSRWYSGSGIYRNVHLIVTEDVHVEHYGVQVVAPNLENQIGSEVDVDVKADIKNNTSEAVDVIVKQGIRNKGSEDIITSAQSDSLKIDANSTLSSEVSLKINDPTLWSLANPHLYEIVTEVLIDGEVVDEYVTDYGFRTIEFDADTGFYLNGEPVKLKGVSMHSDQGSLGAAAHYRAMERQVEIMLEMGANAIRVTHNPAADELIEIANRKGILIIDEAFDTWIKSKNLNRYDYAEWFNEKVGDNPLIGAEPNMTWAELDIKTMVKRGINAPSIISWSTGNEVMEGNSGPYTEYPGILEQLTKWVVELDETRPATIGDNKLKADWREAISFGNTLTNYNGTVGFNYADGSHYDKFHSNYPDWKIYGAETASSINSRGVYKPSNYDRHLTSYDESKVGWGKLSADSWYTTITRDFVAGEFVWTGFDYLGEPTPWNNVGPGATGEWPSPKSSYFGIVDTAGLPKDRYYFYQSQWNEDVNTLHILPAWKEDMIEIDNDGKVRVDVYSDAKSVELFFKDKDGQETSLGKKTFTEKTTDAGYTYQIYEGPDKKTEDFRNLYLTWEVPYEDGTVYAVAYDENDNRITDTEGRDRVTTFKEAAKLNVEADRDTIVANGRDLSYITIDVVDEDGEFVADASNLINVSVSGAGELLALDNGDQLDHEPYDSGKRKAFNGKLVAIVKSTNFPGKITVEVEGEGVKAETITITTTPDTDSSDGRNIVGYTMPKNYYVKLGHQPKLVTETKILFSDGTEETESITWDIDKEMFDEPGRVSISGIVDKYNLRVKANVTVIESVGALLNYSLATPIGVDSVNLPSSRPLVVETGEVLDVEFPVKWEKQNPDNYKEPGYVTINGESTIFGEVIPVTASVRVEDAEITLGDNVAPNYLTLTQSIPEEYQSDSLEAIVDGDRGFKTIGSGDGPNDSVWTNYNMAQEGQREAEIIFTFATAQFLGSADLYFYQDAWAARMPKNVELYWSNEGTEDANWTKIENFEQTVGEPTEGVPNVTKVNYRFNGVPAVGFKIVLTSQDGQNNAGKNLAVGLTEVELFIEERSFVEYSEAILDDILLNGRSVYKSDLDKKVINTEYQKATVETKSDKNVAVTILEPYQDVIRIITESEDHLTREVYVINLNQTISDGLPADDDSRDYPYEKTSATAGDYHKQHATEGDPNYAVDNRLDTIFHTPWNGTDPSNFWITIEMEEPTVIDALRYLSRSGNSNGIVNEYQVMCSLDNESWELVSEGKWNDAIDTWSIAEFEEPVECKYVRLTALSTYGDGQQANKFMSAKEIRLRQAVIKESIEDAEITLEQDIYEYDGEPKTPEVEVTLNSEKLEEGIDYRLVYEDNVEPGEAKVIIQGIVIYTGTIEKPFAILDRQSLSSLIEEAEEIDLTDYPEDKIHLLKDALNTAEKVLEEATTQDEIDEALEALRLAIENLDREPGELYKAALIEKLEAAKNIDLDAYTSESVKLLNEAIESAEEALDHATTQEEIDEALENLKSAINNLEKEQEELNKAPLIEKLEEAKGLDLEGYTSESVAVLNGAIAIAEITLEEATTQEEIEKALEQLDKALAGLEEKPKKSIDKSDLKQAILEAEKLDKDNYTNESWNKLKQALKKAKIVLNNDEASQKEADQALAALEKAVEGLEEVDEEPKPEPEPEPAPVDKSELESRIKKAKELDLDKYTKESVSALEKALKAAKVVLTDDEATQEDIDLALENLEKAIDTLEEIKEDSLPKTGMSAFNYIAIGLILFGIGGVTLYIDRRRKLSNK